ncbi:hypothetical protein [Nocardioides plantarum]|uniref:Uncharacterized protein n=1 Tax=Nocardioides plantarum TaxID=29299 RepID=A0ABV5K528_9ACTN|nr:hypothetical protein [Nocardioides plantarum]
MAFSGLRLDDLSEPVTPPAANVDVVEPNITLVIATVVLVIAL